MDRLAFRNCFVVSRFVRAERQGSPYSTSWPTYRTGLFIPISLKSDKRVFDDRYTAQLISRVGKKVGLERLQRIAGIKNSKKLTTAIAALVLAATAVVAEPLPVA